MQGVTRHRKVRPPSQRRIRRPQVAQHITAARRRAHRSGVPHTLTFTLPPTPAPATARLLLTNSPTTMQTARKVRQEYTRPHIQ